jgi:hypothetical protein
MYDALNAGFKQTDGEIMGWLNADDVYFPWALDTVAQIFIALPEIEWLSTLSPAAIDENGHIFKMRKIAGFSRQAFIDGVYVGFDGLGNPYASDFIQQESTFWRRRLWERVGPDPVRTYRQGGDFALWSLFTAAGAELHGVESPISAWRRSPDQLTVPAIHMSEVEQALGNLRLTVGYRGPRTMDGNFAEYIGRYVLRIDNSWRAEESKFFVMPKSDIKTAIALGRVF